ncbi:MAG: hypothetical protein V1487_02610 [bacterium]
MQNSENSSNSIQQLAQTEELIDDILIAVASGVNTPELQEQLAGLLLRQQDLLAETGVPH